MPALLDLVAAGIGHAALGEDVLKVYEQPQRRSSSRPLRPQLASTLCLVTPAQRRATPLMRAVAAKLVALLGAMLITHSC